MYIVVPPHAVDVVTTGAEGVITLPQSSETVGGVGGETSPAQLTFEDAGGGKVKVGGNMVYV